MDKYESLGNLFSGGHVVLSGAVGDTNLSEVVASDGTIYYLDSHGAAYLSADSARGMGAALSAISVPEHQSRRERLREHVLDAVENVFEENGQKRGTKVAADITESVVTRLRAIGING